MPSNLIEESRFNVDLRGRGYVFTVAMLAAFAVGLLLFRPRDKKYVAETQLSYTPGLRQNADGFPLAPTASSAIAEQIESELRVPETVQAAVEGPNFGSIPYSLEEIAQELYAKLHHYEDESSILRLRYVADDPKFAVSVLDSLTANFIEQHDHSHVESPLEEKKSFAAATVQQWEQRCQQSTDSMAELLQRELTRLETAHNAPAGSRQISEPTAIMPGPTTDLPLAETLPAEAGLPQIEFHDERTVNQRWAELQDQLASAQIQLDKLLETQTPEHPAILQLMSEVESIRQDIQATPGFDELTPPQTALSGPAMIDVATPQALTQPAAVTAVTPSGPFNETAARQAIVAGEAYQQIESRLTDAQAKLAQAQAHLASLTAGGGAEPMSNVETAKLESAAQIVEVMRAPITSKHLLHLLLPSSILGLALALGRRSTLRPEFLYSREDVESSLDLPVVTGVSQPVGPRFELQKNKTPRHVVAGMRLSEAILVACVMLIVLGLTTLPDFATHITSNPFNAFCVGLDHLEAFFISQG